jgi:hypothetical protein
MTPNFLKRLPEQIMTRCPRLTAVLTVCVLGVVANYGCSLHAAENAIPVVLHGRGATPGMNWPLTFGVPFPDGILQDNANIRLLDPDGKEVPIQIRTSARWLSGSIRWVLIDAQPPLPQEKAAYRVEWGAGVVRRAQPAARIAVSESDRSIEVNTGPLQFTLSKENLSVFSEIHVRGLDGQMSSVLPEGTHSDLILEDNKGTIFQGSLASEPEVKIEESGPLRVSIKLEGWMQSNDGRKLGRRIVRVQAFAGKRWLRVYDTWVNTGDSNEVAFRNVAFHLPFQGTRYAFPETAQSAPRDVVTSDYLLQYESNKYEIVADSSVLSTGQKSPGRVDLGQGDTAFSISIRNFWQMCPSEIEINPAMLRIHIWPRHGKAATHLGANMTRKNLGHLWWVHEGEVLDFKNPPELYTIHFKDPDQYDAASRANAFGIATTSEYLFDFHGETVNPTAKVTTRDANPMFVVDPQWLADSQAFWNIAPWREPYLEVEKTAAAPLDFFVNMRDRLDDYGMWNFGAYHKGYFPSLDGAKLHRYWMAFHHGGPRWPWLVFARSGDPKYFDFAETNARHNMDVATCNWEDPEYNEKYWGKAPRSWLSMKFRGGLCKYNFLVHWNAGGRMGYNSPGDYALWYYYMTGYQRAYDVAMMHAEFLLRFTDPIPLKGLDPDTKPPVFSNRNGMSRGNMAITFYRATGDKRYLALAKRQMEYFKKLLDRDEMNAWHIIYAPFIERYYEVTKDPDLEPYIIRWANYWLDPPIEGSVIRNRQALNGREHWYMRDTWYNLLSLGYRLTGDEKFLNYGLQQARLFLETRGANADPVVEGVPLFSDFPGVAGYTAQQFGHFVKALEEHAQKTGKLLTLPKSPDTPLIGTPYRSRRLVFYILKEAGEEVYIPFSFATSSNKVTIWNPRGDRIVKNKEISPETKIAKYDLHLPADYDAGEYRVEFTSALLTAIWPPPGAKYKKLVLEQPDQFMSGVRVAFMPRQAKDGKPVKIRLLTSVRPRRFQTHRLYKPDGSVALAKTLQLDASYRKGDTFLVGEIEVAPSDQGKPWMYSRMMYGHAWLEGDVYPVYAFRPGEFFVPQRFLEE